MIQPSQHPQVSAPLSRLQALWEQGGFALTLQMPPFLIVQSDLHRLTCGHFKALSAVLVADAADRAVALSSLAQAVLLRRSGLTPIVQLSGRDRNRLALQSDLLALGALNLPDIVIDMRPITRASLGKNADARLVLDLDGPALLATAARLCDDAILLSGTRVKTPLACYPGALLALEEPGALEHLSAARFLVSAPPARDMSLAEQLPMFAKTYADLLCSRPLLVSLPVQR